MQITALGHSCVLVDFQQDLQHTRILVDPWLSDHSTGDAMGRFPRLRLEIDALGPVHAVYLTHAHCDHLDPYTLVRLWRELAFPPVLLLPVSLSFLLPVLHAHLPSLDVRLLAPHTPMMFRGLELLGFYDIGLETTNEDDVMILVATNGAERVLVEADARLSLELLDFRAFISALMCQPGIDSAVYLTTENELSGTMASRLCPTAEAREAVRSIAIDELLEEASMLYEPVSDPDDIWQDERVLRLIHGQGLTAPQELDDRWQHILFPVRIADRVEEERAVAARSGCRHHIDSLTPGCVHTITSGRITQRMPASGLVLLDQEADRRFASELTFSPSLPCAPLRSDARDQRQQRAQILALLNDRFLPFLHGQQQPPVLHLLAAYGGSYRVRVRFGCAREHEVRDFVFGFSEPRFIEVQPSESPPQESYWANDLEDFLGGRCDEFSTFCRQQLPADEMRLWVCLATPLLNSDLVSKRVALHFERARQGLSPGSWVMEMWGAAE